MLGKLRRWGRASCIPTCIDPRRRLRRTVSDRSRRYYSRITYHIPGWATIRSIMALIRGVGSLVPCPRCLIPEDKLGSHSVRAALRTTADMREIISKARGERFANAGEEILKAVGLRDVDVYLCSNCSRFVLPLMTLNRMSSGRSVTRTHTMQRPSIASILSLAVCSGITCGSPSRLSWRRWAGLHVLRLMRCTYLFLYSSSHVAHNSCQ